MKLHDDSERKCYSMKSERKTTDIAGNDAWPLHERKEKLLYG